MKTLRTIGAHITKGITAFQRFAWRHKIVSVIALVLVIGGGYMTYHAFAAGTTGTEYTLASVTQGPLEVSVTGSGTVTANDTLSLSPKASGQVTQVNVTVGQVVKAGTIIAEVDMTDAARTVTSARQSLASAEISYQQTLTSTQNTTSNDQTSVQTLQTTAVSTLGTTYANLPNVMSGLDSVLHNLSTLTGYTAQQNIDAYENLVPSAQAAQYKDAAESSYQAANAAYISSRNEYEGLDTNSLSDTAAVVQDSALTTKKINTAIQAALTYYNYINTQSTGKSSSITSTLATQINSLTGYLSTVGSDTSNLTSSNTSLTSAEQSVQKDQQTLGTNTVSLDVQSAQLNLQKAKDSLAQALQDESDYIVRAPFDGTIATVPVHVYDQAGSGTAIATLITKGNYVDLSINEADISKISLGQAATLTFDAIDGLTANGTVAEVDPVGAVSQGVVTYTVKIGLTTVDDRIKPGMTADATIITSSIASAIQVPSSAVHTTNGQSYVEVATLTNASSTMAGMGQARTGGSFNASSTGAFRREMGSSSSAYGTASTTGRMGSSTMGVGTSRSLTVPATDVTITRVPVVTGISNDTMIQIESGLSRGQLVVSSTVSGSSKTSASSGGLFSSLFGGKRTTTGTTGTRSGYSGTAGAGRTGTTGTGGASAGGFGGGAGGPPGQ